jgi:dephospho-CoA kinase
MKIVGIVGGSGTGKTTIAEHIVRGRNAGHIDADRVAHEILQRDAKVRRRIKARFGTRVFDGDEIDRAKLGELVFATPELLRALNSIIHPAIIEECIARLESMRDEGKELVVIDAALLLEVPVPFRFDLMIALRCGPEEQLRRLIAKGGAGEDDLRARLDSQSNIEKSFYRADVVVDTGRPIDEVLNDVDKLVRLLLGDGR